LFSCCFSESRYRDIVIENAEYFAIDPTEVFAVIRIESGFRESVVSEKGAIGLMQILPKTGEWIAEELSFEEYTDDSLFDPTINIRFGCFYLSYLHRLFEQDWAVFASYNAGEGRVSEWISKGIVEEDIPYPETLQYVRKVKRAMKYYVSKKIALNY